MTDHMAAVAERFARETANHCMYVLHDDGPYRHVRFKSEKNSFYWFDLITVPGTLIFQGDGTSYVFRHTPDMFEFFRGQRVNPSYWSEKLTSCQQDEVKQYDREIFERRVKDAFVDLARHGGVPAGLGRAVRSEILEAYESDDEAGAHRVLREFEFYKNDADRYDPKRCPDFQFSDTWEWDFRDYDWWFLWSCHAIVWGIAQYDAGTQRPAQSTVTGGVL